MDELEEGSAPFKATRAHIGHINHSWDRGSIFSRQRSIYSPNCPCPSTVRTPPRSSLKIKKRPESEKRERRKWLLLLLSVGVFLSFTLALVDFATSTGVHH